MAQRKLRPKVTKRKIVIRMVGQVLITIGVITAIVLRLFNKLGLIEASLCIVLVLMGLVLSASPEAWLDVIRAGLLGGN